ncbi:hypothetical protein DFQ28_001463 [Apophysomyces sp. BC1034]|nr:hypothetical protein DFQ29_009010 [Apophysomyces sp. BC1021]KAG0190836.1 hypothetical protein DFQ28_001463 [Apophysomyces sp. BC1034]
MSEHPLDFRRAPSPPPRPHIELYKPTKRQPQILTKSFTLPSFQHHTDPHQPSTNHAYPQSISQRSVLGLINNPAGTNVTTVPLSPPPSHPPSIVVASSSAGPRVSSMHEQDKSRVSEEEEIESDDDDSQLDELDEDDNEGDDEGAGVDEEEEPVLSEARVNRKIADLEISNQSLLAVNAMLEATVRKQASQVTQLKKQVSQGDYIHVEPLLLEEKKESASVSDEEWEKDEVFMRLCKLTDQLIEKAEAAVKYEYKGVARVLSSYVPETGPNGNEAEDQSTDLMEVDELSKEEEEKVEETKEEVEKKSPKLSVPPRHESRHRSGSATLPRRPVNTRSPSFHKDKPSVAPTARTSSKKKAASRKSAPQ